MKKFLLTLLLSTSSFLIQAEDISFGDWKYVEIDNSHYATTKSGSVYITYKNKKKSEKFSFVSNVPCNHVTGFWVNDNEVSFLCKRNKWGNMSMTFPQKSDDYIFEQFKKSNSVKFKQDFSDGSDGKVTLSALGFTKASSKGLPKKSTDLTIQEQQAAAVKEAKKACSSYKQYQAPAYRNCIGVYLSNYYSHLKGK